MESQHLKELIAYMQDRGFVYGPEPEIYGGLAGFYTYGPLGKLLKNNVENAIRKVFQIDEFFEVECPTVMQDKVWEASGHLGGFTDPLIKCSKCEAIFRVDTLVAERLPDLTINPADHNDLLRIVKENKIACPACKGAFKQEIKQHSLMMGTTIGVDTHAYNRPETATTTYLPFMRYKEFFREKLPFGVFQIGKAYRNEISPRQHLLRMREFTQAEGQMFLFPDQKSPFDRFEPNLELPLWDWKSQKENRPAGIVKLGDARKSGLLKNDAYAWTLSLAHKLFLQMGIPAERIRFRQHFPDEKAFYADDAWDLEVQTDSFGWVEMAGVHDRTDYDLKQHGKFAKKELFARTEKGEKIVPHVLEIAFGTDRPTFALLDLFYEKKDKAEGKTRLNLPYALAPVQVAVFPLLNKLEEGAKEVFAMLKEEFICLYDRSGAIGRRYLRADSVGVPFCVTYDFDSKEKGTVTIRDRDSAEQIRVPLKKLSATLNDLLSGKKKI